MVHTLLTGFLGCIVFVTFGSNFSTFSYSQNDTLKIVSVGENNLVVIDSIQITELSDDSFPQSITGEISQTGENNRIEISNAKPNAKQKVTITQTGKNNKVKINSH